MTLFLLLSSVLFLTSQLSLSQDPQFAQHMIDHPIKGCPTNSSCTPKNGRLLTQWHQLLESKTLYSGKGLNRKKIWLKKLNQFKKKHGIPFQFWTDREESPILDLIQWESPCRLHRPQFQLKAKKQGLLLANKRSSQPIYKKVGGKTISMLLMPQFRPPQGLPGNHYFNSLITLNDQKKLQSFLISNQEVPLYRENNSFVFTRQEKGVYYSYRLTEKGQIELISRKKIKIYPEAVQCPSHLLAAYKKLRYPKDLFPTTVCMKIWNRTQQKHNIIIYGKSCL